MDELKFKAGDAVWHKVFGIGVIENVVPEREVAPYHIRYLRQNSMGKIEWQFLYNSDDDIELVADIDWQNYKDYTAQADKMPESLQPEVDKFKKLVNDTMVNHPPHYCKGGVECIVALEAATAGLQGIEAVCTANAIKYLWRHKHKNGVQDLKKAQWYIEKLIKHYENIEK